MAVMRAANFLQEYDIRMNLAYQFALFSEHQPWADRVCTLVHVESRDAKRRTVHAN